MDVSLNREVRGHIFFIYKVAIYIKVPFILFKISIP